MDSLTKMKMKKILYTVILLHSLSTFASNPTPTNYSRDLSHIPAKSEVNKNIDFSHINGSVIAYSSPSSKVFLGSPSIIILPDGTYIASHDIFGKNWKEKNGTSVMIYQSKDKGKTWQWLSRVNGQNWNFLWYHNNAIYLIGCLFPENGFAVRKSVDGGKTWTIPDNDKSGLILKTGQRIISTPTPVAIVNDRIYVHMEQPNKKAKMWAHQYSFVMSAPINSDLLNSENWTKSTSVIIPDQMVTLAHGGWLEGNVVHRRSDNKIFNILRVHGITDECAAFYEISHDGKKAKLNTRNMFIRFPGSCKKFYIVYDEKTEKYFALSNYVLERDRGEVKNCPHPIKAERTRNTLALLESSNLMDWKVKSIIITHPDIEHCGFQYPSAIIDGNDLIAVVRTAYYANGEKADSQHNSNMITFHRIEKFRDRNLTTKPLMGEIPFDTERK